MILVQWNSAICHPHIAKFALFNNLITIHHVHVSVWFQSALVVFFFSLIYWDWIDNWIDRLKCRMVINQTTFDLIIILTSLGYTVPISIQWYVSALGFVKNVRSSFHGQPEGSWDTFYFPRGRHEQTTSQKCNEISKNINILEFGDYENLATMRNTFK